MLTRLRPVFQSFKEFAMMPLRHNINLTNGVKERVGEAG